ncbi:MAG: hypothetical protein JWP89_3981 [Schlesneria sp.]|nr:hypothetical protein [Schlesneria sp.]
MTGQRIAFGLGLILVLNSWVLADEAASVKGSMTINRKKYKLTYVKAYRIKSDGKDSVAVIVSQKPFQMDKPKLFPSRKPDDIPRWIDLMSVSVPTEFEQIRNVVPHLQAVFDEKTGKITSYQGWASGSTFMSVAEYVTVTVSVNGKESKNKSFSDVSGSWTAKIEGNRIVGSGVCKDDSPFVDLFDFEFNVLIEKLEVVTAE